MKSLPSGTVTKDAIVWNLVPAFVAVQPATNIQSMFSNSEKNRSGRKPSQQFPAVSLQICNGTFTSRSSVVLVKMWIWTEIVTIVGDMSK